METGEYIKRSLRTLAVSGAMLGVAISGTPAGAEEMPAQTTTETAGNPDDMPNTSVVITGEPSETTTTTVQAEPKPESEDDGWDRLGDGLQFLGMMGFLAVATGFFDSTEDSRRRRRR